MKFHLKGYESVHTQLQSNKSADKLLYIKTGNTNIFFFKDSDITFNFQQDSFDRSALHSPVTVVVVSVVTPKRG